MDLKSTGIHIIVSVTYYQTIVHGPTDGTEVYPETQYTNT
jgi:hypothetical protein